MRLAYREDFVREATRLREQGLLLREIAERFGVAHQTVHGWLDDPDLSKQRERRKKYAGRCVECGAATDGSNGRAKAPKRCKECAERPKPIPHGTVSGRTHYKCECDACRTAYREYHREARRRRAERGPDKHGTENAYTNYKCRCSRCLAAHRQWERLHPEYQRRWYEKKKREKAA